MNSVAQNIKRKIVDPAISSIRHSAVGFVTVVYHDSRLVDVTYRDSSSKIRTAKNIPFPKYGDGVFSESLKAGDIVELGYRNQDKKNMYIVSVIKRDQAGADFICEKGSSLMLSTNLL